MREERGARPSSRTASTNGVVRHHFEQAGLAVRAYFQLVLHPGPAARANRQPGRQLTRWGRTLGSRQLFRSPCQQGIEPINPGCRDGGAVEQYKTSVCLDNLPGVHHGHPVGHFGNHTQVVGNQDHRGAHVGAQAAHQVQIWAWMVNPGQFVARLQSEAGVERQGHRNHYRWACPRTFRGESAGFPFRVRMPTISVILPPGPGLLFIHILMDLQHSATWSATIKTGLRLD